MKKLLARACTLACTLVVMLAADHAMAQTAAQTAAQVTAQSAAQTAAPAPIDPALAQHLQALARQAAAQVWGRDAQSSPGMQTAVPRIEVEIGQLDARLVLAPCQQIEPYVPVGARMAGRTRMGLRCLQGSSKWNVYLPLTVKIFGRALVTSTALPGGTVVRAHHLAEAEVDLAVSAEPVIQSAELVLGRTLAKPLAAGDAFRSTDLKARHWFAAGETVKVVAIGPGFSVSAQGLALGPGLEGQPTRVRTESGRIVTGMPTAERRLEIAL